MMSWSFGCASWAQISQPIENLPCTSFVLTFREAFGFEGGVPPHPRPHSAKVFRNNSGPCGPTSCPQQAEPNSTKPTNTQRESELPSFGPRQLCRWSVVHQDPPTLRPATSPEQVGLIHDGVCLPVDTPKRRPSDKSGRHTHHPSHRSRIRGWCGYDGHFVGRSSAWVTRSTVWNGWGTPT